MNTSSCPAADVLAAFVSGELTPQARDPVQTHVSHCDDCLETVAFLTSRVSQSESDEPTRRVLAEAQQMIGPYRLLRCVGEGGMGEVWEAQQLAPVRRIVALKLLKAGMDTRQIISRFEGERQMLALMQHPSIAQVFDAGITDAGRPYFVMEFVDGARITSYCDQHQLDLRQRLRLFQQVCEAVQHAHQKGVIHRDLKPSNVLVAQHADSPLPKVIDFGLAKATTAELPDASLTEFGTMLGTPAYASPEQMSLGALDIDTRSDVYSLGALLYELLVGVLPFEADGASGVLELRRAIRERDPAKPSTRISRLGERISIIAQARGLEPSRLRRQLRGELDWIVMKALEKERDRRYISPHELALDIERYLNAEPLQAAPPATTYRIRKFVQRHRAVSGFAALVAALTIAFITVTIVQARRIAVERDRATAEAAKATSINAFLQETLGSADPWETGGDISIREVLADAARKADEEFKDQPLVAAAVKNTIGRTYMNLGQLDVAEQLVRESLDVRRAHLGELHPDVAASLFDLALVFQHQSKYEESTALALESLALRRKLFGDRSAEVAESLDQVAVDLDVQAQYDGAQRAAEEALATREHLFGAQSTQVADTLLTLSSIATNGRSDIEQAQRLSQRAYDIYSNAYGLQDLRTAYAATSVGVKYWTRGENEKALEYYRKALAVYEKVAGADHPETATSRENVANALARMKRFEESIPLLEQTLAVRRAKAGETAAVTLRTLGNLAAHEMQSGRLDQARARFEAAMPGYAQSYGEDHPDYASLLTNYAALLRKTSEHERAEALLRQALAIRQRKLGVDHLSTAKTRADLGVALLDRGAFVEAEQLLTQAHRTRAQQLGKDHEQTRSVAESLVRLYIASGRTDKASEFKGAAAMTSTN